MEWIFVILGLLIILTLRTEMYYRYCLRAVKERKLDPERHVKGFNWERNTLDLTKWTYEDFFSEGQ